MDESPVPVRKRDDDLVRAVLFSDKSFAEFLVLNEIAGSVGLGRGIASKRSAAPHFSFPLRARRDSSARPSGALAGYSFLLAGRFFSFSSRDRGRHSRLGGAIVVFASARHANDPLGGSRHKRDDAMAEVEPTSSAPSVNLMSGLEKLSRSWFLAHRAVR